jgi:Ca2+/Na+ antiporter
MVFVLASGVGILALTRMFPKQEEYWAWMERADIWTMIVLLLLFAVYAIVRLAIRLAMGIRDEWRPTRSKDDENPPPR